MARWRRGTRSTNTWRRSTSWRSRSASIVRRKDQSDALLARRGDARRLPRLGGRDAEAAREGGAVERGEQKEALLTAAGRVRAERAVRKHRIIERLLTDFMGYTAAEAHSTPTSSATPSARRWSSGSTRSSGARALPPRLAGRHPRRAGGESRARAVLVARSRRRRNDRAARRARRRAPALVLRQGLVPGATIELAARAGRPPGSSRLRVERRRRSDQQRAAAGLYVRPSRQAGAVRATGPVAGSRAPRPRGARRPCRCAPR